MNGRSQKPEVRSQNRAARWFALLALLASGFAALAVDLASLRADRAAMERVYCNHRLGEKPPFEQVLPATTLENLVRQDLRKEAALKQTYGVEVTPAMLDAVKKRFGPDAQILSSPHAGDGKERKFYFEDLPGELQNVLRVQLRQAGDVSAVVEMPGGFLLYLAREKTAETLRAAILSIPKCSYEGWLNEPN